MLIIRPATQSDEPVAQQVAQAAFAALRGVYRPTASAQEDHQALANTLNRLVAVEEQPARQIVGTVEYHIERNVLRVVGLAVRAENRKQGIAAQLMAALLDIARQAGCRALGLYTVRETGNVPVFERLGFTLQSEAPAEFCESPTGEPLREAYLEREL